MQASHRRPPPQPGLVARLDDLRKEAQAGLVQSHVTAGDVYTATGNYADATAQADVLLRLHPGSVEAHALHARIHEAKAWANNGIRVGAVRRLGR